MNIRKFIFIFTGSLFIFCDNATSKNKDHTSSPSSQSKIPITPAEESDTTLSEKLKEKNALSEQSNPSLQQNIHIEPPIKNPNSQLTNPGQEPPIKNPHSQSTNPGQEPPIKNPHSQSTNPGQEQPSERQQVQSEHTNNKGETGNKRDKLEQSKQIFPNEFGNWDTEKVVKWLDTIGLPEEDKNIIIKNITDNTIVGSELINADKADLFLLFEKVSNVSSLQILYDEINKIKNVNNNVIFNVLNNVPRLQNLRNTCFINAAIQCLLKDPLLVRQLLSAKLSTDSSMLNEIIKLCYKIDSDKSKVFSIEKIDSLLRSSPGGLRVEPGLQDDAGYAFSSFIAVLEYDSKQQGDRYIPIREIFHISIYYTYKCLICGYSKDWLRREINLNLYTENPLVSISFDLNNHHYQLYIDSDVHIKTLKYKLYHCLKDNNKDIKLTDITNQISIKYKNSEFDNLKKCEELVDKQDVLVAVGDRFITNLKINKENKNFDINASLISSRVNITLTTDKAGFRCKCPDGVSKASDHTEKITKNPNTLVLKIDRSITDTKTKANIKDNHLLHYPENLNFNGDNYSLYGVVNYDGTLDSGHYWAFVKTADNKWYKASDSSVTQISVDDVINKNTAMILFYIKH